MLSEEINSKAQAKLEAVNLFRVPGAKYLTEIMQQRQALQCIQPELVQFSLLSTGIHIAQPTPYTSGR